MLISYVPRGTFLLDPLLKGVCELNTEFSDIFDRFAAAGIPLNENQGELMNEMIGFLQDYCKKVNLTAIRDREGIIEKHLVDSVLPLRQWEVPEGTRCLDIGTGAGFPAVPMMIYRSDLKFTLLDSQRKRTDYLSLLTEKLGLKAEIIHGRAEELWRQKGYNGRYGMVTARAVADLPTLIKYAAPFLKSGGVFLAMRGSKDEMSDEVVKSAVKLSMNVENEICYELPCGDGRRLVVFRKA